MKKLMIACAVTISAFALQAASFVWGAAMITDGKDGPLLTAATAPGVFGIMNLTTGQFQEGGFDFDEGGNGGGGEFALTVGVDKDGDIMSLVAYNDISHTYTQVMNSDGTAAQVALSGFGDDPMSIKVARASFQRNAGLFAIAREGCLSGLQRGS